MTAKATQDNPVKWNPWNKVVQDHRTGEIDHAATNAERKIRGLTTPWTEEIGTKECRTGRPVF